MDKGERKEGWQNAWKKKVLIGIPLKSMHVSKALQLALLFLLARENNIAGKVLQMQSQKERKKGEKWVKKKKKKK